MERNGPPTYAMMIVENKSKVYSKMNQLYKITDFEEYAIFIHGCYWHRHKGCKYAYTPKTNVEFWTNKLEKNKEHDREVVEQLNKLGIRVLTVWECTIEKMMKGTEEKDFELEKIISFLRNETKEVFSL